MVQSSKKDLLEDLRSKALFRSPEEWLDDPDLIEAVRGMPPRRQAVLFLRFALDLTQADVAETLGINQQAVSRHESRAIQTLRSLSISLRSIGSHVLSLESAARSGAQRV